jgi:hypothetical protein
MIFLAGYLIIPELFGAGRATGMPSGLAAAKSASPVTTKGEMHHG